tara:strand:- start:6928 stop:7179 length:252 start_codon:yes stop_codon:yes gene_type:complete
MVTPIQLEYKGKEMKKDFRVQLLVDALFWEYQRMSKEGQKTLDKLATLVEVKKEDNDIEQEKKKLLAMGCPEESLHLYLGKDN